MKIIKFAIGGKDKLDKTIYISLSLSLFESFVSIKGVLDKFVCIMLGSRNKMSSFML